jgi:uncharacterized LabA/DUF88 family protein
MPSPGGFFCEVKMDNVAILVDAEFFIKQFRRHNGGECTPKQLADGLYDACIKHLSNRKNTHRDRLYRVIVYDCPPMTKKVHHPITKRAIDLSKSKVATDRVQFHAELKKQRKVALRLGYIDEENAAWSVHPMVLKDLLQGRRTIGDLTENEVNYIGRQKAVDMKIGLDIASLALKKMVEKIILIAGDSDFVPAAKLARREGIDFVLDPMWKTIKPDLQEHIDGIRTTIRKSPPAIARGVEEQPRG